MDIYKIYIQTYIIHIYINIYIYIYKQWLSKMVAIAQCIMGWTYYSNGSMTQDLCVLKTKIHEIIPQ